MNPTRYVIMAALVIRGQETKDKGYRMFSSGNRARAQRTAPKREIIPTGRNVEKYYCNNGNASRCRGFSRVGKTVFTCQNIQNAPRHPAVIKANRPPAQNAASRWIGYIIRHERRRQQLTQARLTAALQFGASALSTIENGRAFANIERTLQVAHYLHLDVATLAVAVRAQIIFHTTLQTLRRQEVAVRDRCPQETPQALTQWKTRVAEGSLDRPYGSREP